MGKFIKEFLWRASFVVIGALLGPFIYKIFGQQYPEFINRQPQWLFILILCLIIIILFIVFVFHRKAVVRKSNLDRDVPDWSISPAGDEDFGLLKYKGVGWKTEFPKPLFSYDPFGQEDPKKHLLEVDLDRIRVSYFPFCPECCSRLKERDTFLGLHLWECKKCNFKKRSIRSFYYESKRATIKARKEFENIKNGCVSDSMILYPEYRDLFIKSS
jgi:ribosomal protein L37AE/L43A/uncharacterized membrane protein